MNRAAFPPQSHLEGGQLRLRGQVAKEAQVRGLQEVSALGQLLNRVAPGGVGLWE